MQAAEISRILELTVSAPIGSYADALQHKPLIDKFVRLHNQLAQGARFYALSEKEAALVDAMRRGMACIAPGNTGPAAHAEGIVPAGQTPSSELLSAASE
jgi:hypothetical protein